MTAPETLQRLVLVTGPSGAGRSTAIHALEDLGFEVIDNLPLTLLDRLLDGRPLDRSLALGIDVRNRDFATDTLIRAIDSLQEDARYDLSVLYCDCSEEVLIRRYSETRRRHPLSPGDAPIAGIEAEASLLAPIRARATVLIDSSDLTPHDLRTEVSAQFGPPGGRQMGVTVQSFSYKRGLPRGADIVLDCRFLRNPHWEPGLRHHDGRADEVAAYVAADSRYEAFFEGVRNLAALLLPAYREEGKTHLSIAFGCTGGQHRSVAVAERLAETLAKDGWAVSKRHRELERQGKTSDSERDKVK
jgi:UPF0042 nucleotide-binding protein